MRGASGFRTSHWNSGADAKVRLCGVETGESEIVQTRVIGRAARKEGAKAGEWIGMPVGHVVGSLTPEISSADVIDQFIDEFVEATERIQASLGAANASEQAERPRAVGYEAGAAGSTRSVTLRRDAAARHAAPATRLRKGR